MFLFSRFFDLTYTHTPGIGRKRLLHLIATTPLYLTSAADFLIIKV